MDPIRRHVGALMQHDDSGRYSVPAKLFTMVDAPKRKVIEAVNFGKWHSKRGVLRVGTRV